MNLVVAFVSAMLLAAFLLLGWENMQEVALQCGYEDYTQFSQIFKIKVGVSPKKFQISRLEK